MQKRLPSSFRDPSGFIFEYEGKLYRQINQIYQKEYDQLVGSGLYDELVEKSLIIPHRDAESVPMGPEGYKVIAPDPIDIISYPFEWSFSQLKDATLTMLEIQKLALTHGMSLKDASGYNIQFHNGRPIFIDSLSFDPYAEGKPWVAYRQFCQHFLAPLLLMRYVDVRLSGFSRLYIDGIPLGIASRLLPAKTWLLPGCLIHIHLHAKAQNKYGSETKITESKHRVSKLGLLGMIDNLETLILKLIWSPQKTEWGDYYSFTNYSEGAFEEKKKITAEFLKNAAPESVVDLGANTGTFSGIAAKEANYVVSCDIDPAAVEKNYQQCKSESVENVLPLLIDLTNPSPTIGWANQERPNIWSRIKADCVMALALIHHLAISNNVPLPRISEFLKNLAPWLIIEFVPKGDSQIKKLLANREDIFPDYTTEGFESAFKTHFDILEKKSIVDSDRSLYLMKRNCDPL